MVLETPPATLDTCETTGAAAWLTVEPTLAGPTMAGTVRTGAITATEPNFRRVISRLLECHGLGAGGVRTASPHCMRHHDRFPVSEVSRYTYRATSATCFRGFLSNV